MLNAAQFVAFAVVLFSLPYVLPVAAGLHTAKINQHGTDRLRFLLLVFVEVAVAIAVLGIIGGGCLMDSGLIDNRMFVKAPEYMVAVWELCCAAVAVVGIKLGLILFYRGIRLRNSGNRGGYWQMFFGFRCLVYGLQVELLMQMFLASIRDFYLMG